MNAALSIAGVAAERMMVPSDRVQLAATVRQLYDAGRSFAFVGGGTELELGNAPRTLDAVVRTTALDRIIEYSPEDQTITVEAGVTFAALDRLLEKNGQIFPLDVADREHATIGGAIATNTFGARRHRFGAMKDLIVGIEFVRPDGTLAHGGGKVVKNVAGFDLPKLLVGSLGTLGAIASATLRVFPRAEAGGTVVVPGTSAAGDHTADPIAAAVEAAQLVATSIVQMRVDGERSQHVLQFDGTAAAVDAQIARVLDLFGAAYPDAHRADADEVRSLAAVERSVRRDGTWRTLTLTAPSNAGQTQRAVRFAWHGADAAVCYPTLGAIVACGSERSDETLDDAIAAVDIARAEIVGTMVVHAMPRRWRGHVDAWGTPPPSFPIMRALKANFDPKGLCNPGRYVGGL